MQTRQISKDMIQIISEPVIREVTGGYLLWNGYRTIEPEYCYLDPLGTVFIDKSFKSTGDDKSGDNIG